MVTSSYDFWPQTSELIDQLYMTSVVMVHAKGVEGLLFCDTVFFRVSPGGNNGCQRSAVVVASQ